VSSTYGPPQVTVYALRSGEPLVAYRIVRSEHREDPVFIESFRSHYELHTEPRRVERSSSVIHMGISMYLDEGVARKTAQTFPKIGNWVARLELTHGQGFNYAHTGPRLHLTIWGDPVKLSRAAVDISPVWT
jgi:hypothetical protein